MRQSLKRIRGAIGMGITWALGWAPVAVLVGTQIIDPDDSMDEMWVMVGALPGFLSGVLFSIVVGVAARRQRLDELTIARVARWGAIAGLFIGILPFLIGDTDGSPPAWLLAAIIIPTFTVLSTLSAAGSLAIARRALRRESANIDAAFAGMELTDAERESLLGETRGVRQEATFAQQSPNGAPFVMGRR
jgi:threonine/homoserine/homoserine lactone efflux protein